MMVVACNTLPSFAGNNIPEYTVKSAFLYNFFKFAEWPASSANQATWNLCVAGGDPFGAALDGIEGKIAQGKPLQILRDVKGDALRSCHMVFTAEKDSVKVQSILRHVNSNAVLTVGEGQEFIDNGGMIGLMLLNEKLVFEVNLDPAQAVGIRLNAQLLRLATKVTGVQRKVAQ